MLLKAIFTNSSGILFSRILGFVRDLLTASVLGANIYSDIFFVAFKLPNLFRRIFGEGAFTQAFLPSFVHARHKGAFTYSVFLRFMLIILILSVLTVLLDVYVTKVIAFGFDEATLMQAAPLVAINFWYLDFIFIVTFMGALLQYKNHFATTAYSTALLNIALIGALLLSRGLHESEIVYYMSYGVLIGGVLQVAVHLLALRGRGLYKLFAIGHRSVQKAKDTGGDVKRFYKQFFPALLGSSTAQISAFLDTFLASFLMSGSISYLYYANRVFQLPMALFAIAVATALFPTIAKALKHDDESKALGLMEKSFWILTFTLALSTVGGILLSNEITWLLFERGAFERADTLNSGWVLVMYMVGLLPFGLAKIFSLWLYSKGEQMAAAKISAKSLGYNIVLSVILIFPMEAAGLALASSLSGFLLLYWTLRHFGWSRFFTIIRAKYILLLLLAVAIEVGIIEIFKTFYRIG